LYELLVTRHGGTYVNFVVVLGKVAIIELVVVLRKVAIIELLGLLPHSGVASVGCQ
jgi:hypothetical protein